MSSVVEAPLNLIESVADLRFPPRADARVRALMDRNTNGQLSPDEKAELEAWVEVSENIALVRARALRVLGRTPT
jgi:hypothetical protein